MGDLLNVGERIASFTLPIAGGNETLLSSDIIGVRRTMLLVLDGDEDGAAVTWLRAASQRAAALNGRDITILVIAPKPEKEAGLSALPSPLFQVLRDTCREEAKHLGDAPAFYLVGKDGTIKRTERGFPPLDELFQQIDSMPMRQQEMRLYSMEITS